LSKPLSRDVSADKQSGDLAVETYPAKPTIKIGGSWLMTCVYEYGAKFVLFPSLLLVLRKPIGRGMMAEINSL